jgi:hypothetical protein
MPQETRLVFRKYSSTSNIGCQYGLPTLLSAGQAEPGAPFTPLTALLPECGQQSRWLAAPPGQWPCILIGNWLDPARSSRITRSKNTVSSLPGLIRRVIPPDSLFICASIQMTCERYWAASAIPNKKPVLNLFIQATPRKYRPGWRVAPRSVAGYWSRSRTGSLTML